ncbi:hypothetical protein [Bacillus sp. FJAT-29814]|uniref:hypothetical protein n=1 Tax=Bacillus sp. FJAT-29814 TaxID=1729688 RepID=UPI00082E02AE|nr:hypothetical protein [Bacillus sp. FJAT-29814]
MSYKLYGAIGFGLGGLIAGIAGDYMVQAFLLSGFLGSAFLTIPARNIKLTVMAGIFGGIGFFIGFAVPIFVFLTFFELPLKYLFIGLFLGLTVGLLIGIVFRNIKDFMVWGTVGFGLSWWIAFSMLEWFRAALPGIFSGVVMMIACAIGGACLGHAASKSKRRN